jgi:hypothetical protein
VRPKACFSLERALNDIPHRTIPLVEIVDSFQVFQSQGTQGLLLTPSNQQLDTLFGTHNDVEVVTQMLKKGALQGSQEPEKSANRNDNRCVVDICVHSVVGTDVSTLPRGGNFTVSAVSSFFADEFCPVAKRAVVTGRRAVRWPLNASE